MPAVPTLAEQITAADRDLADATRRRSALRAEAQTILAAAERAGRDRLTSDEDARLRELETDREHARRQVEAASDRLAELRAVEQEERDAMVLQQRTQPAAQRPANGQQRAVVGREARTYRPDQDPSGRAFLLDVARAHFGIDWGATERLQRHMTEERVERPEYFGREERAIGTGAVTGLVVPQYLTDLYAPAVAALRPFANLATNRHPLPPDGMTVNLSRITTGTSVALQASEGAAVSETNADDTLLTENVQTAAGQQTVSRQAIERGAGVDDILMEDLFRRWATSLDSTMLNQATTGVTAVATATAYADTSPTAPELYRKVLGSVAGVEASLLAQAVPDYVVMHSRRWHWLGAEQTSTWPFINQPGIPPQSSGASTGVGYDQGVRGKLPNGMAVIVDNNVGTSFGTNEDEVYVVASGECHLWEDPAAPVLIRSESSLAATLQVLLVVYGYFAYSVRRYTGHPGKVNGTGLITPTF
jgi:hypothetical protein